MRTSLDILVVDDLFDNRNLLAQLLRHEGHRVREAADGLEALEAIASARPDILILDLQMPRLDGFGVLERLREADEALLPVLVVTAASERESRLRALELGAQDFLGKPVDTQELQARVRTLGALKLAHDRVREQAEQLKQANNTLVRQNERIELEVARRTEALRAANEQLLSADRYKDEFLSVISHELRTPLNFIMGFASVLADEISGPLNDHQRAQAEKILQGTDRMLLLVDDLLDIARMRAGQLRIDPQPTPLGPLLEEVLATMQPLAIQKGVLLSGTIEVPGEPWLDGPRFVQVLTNLIGNAIKFTPGGGRVQVTAGVAGEVLVVEVNDTGCGIAPSDLPRLFKRFEQLDMSNTRQAGGLGLGLSICKMLIDAHGGAIEVASDLGAGSTFSVRLPIAFGAERALTASSEAAGAPHRKPELNRHSL